MNQTESVYFDGFTCPSQFVLALKDAMNAISGKWKLAVVSTLLSEKRRFSDIQRIIPTITPRMLSKELKELEANGVITRKVVPVNPVIIEYELTPSGRKLITVINAMVGWGLEHRESILSASS